MRRRPQLYSQLESFAEHAWGIFDGFVSQALGRFEWVDNQRCFAHGGHNGPHHALETPVRNTAHWITALSIYSRFVEREDVRVTLKGLRNWLLLNNSFFRNDGYLLRQKPGYDSCNGVIGHAWVLEALSRLHRYCNDDLAVATARSIGDRHVFNSSQGLWRRYDSWQSGRNRVDLTFDHQAWFAAAAMDCGRQDEVIAFLDACNRGTLMLRANGRAHHLARTNTLRGWAALLSYTFSSRKRKETIAMIETCYHHYLLFPIARMSLSLPDHPFFGSGVVSRAINYFENCDVEDLAKHPLGFGYNAPGFEYPMVVLAFAPQLSHRREGMESVLNRQCELTMNASHTSCVRVADTLTLTARIYELGLFFEACADHFDWLPNLEEAELPRQDAETPHFISTQQL